MGLTASLTFPASFPSWEVLRDHLAGGGLAFELRMIDGQLAFPDEVPTPEWRELRISLLQGMITLRREQNTLSFIIWGNADPALVAARDAFIRACAERA